MLTGCDAGRTPEGTGGVGGTPSPGWAAPCGASLLQEAERARLSGVFLPQKRGAVGEGGPPYFSRQQHVNSVQLQTKKLPSR